MKLNLIDILNNLGLNQTEQNKISCKKTATNFNDILGLFLTQFFVNFKAENFETFCPPRDGKFPSETLDREVILETQTLDAQKKKQPGVFISDQKPEGIETSLIFTFEPFLLAEGEKILRASQSLSLKSEVNLKQKIRESAVGGAKEVESDEAIPELVIAKEIKISKEIENESVKDEIKVSMLENSKNEIDLKFKSVLKKGEKVEVLGLEQSTRTIASRDDVKIFESGVVEILKKDGKINMGEAIFKSGKLQSQFKNQGHSADIKSEGKDVVLASFERDQARGDFNLQHEFKKFELGSVKFGKVNERVSNWSSSFIDVVDVGGDVSAGNFVLSVKAKEIPDVIKTFVFRDDFVYGEVILKVEPEEIGEVIVKISQGEKGVRILFEVKNFEAKQLIESGFGSLKATLESNNVNPEKIGVLLVDKNLSNSCFNSSNSARGQLLKKASKKKIFDSFETVKIYGGSLIEAII